MTGTTGLKKWKRLAAVGAVAQAALFAQAVLPAPAGANETKYCYPASADGDLDGYAASGTASVGVTVSDVDLNCPSGYVGKAGDCNDSDAAVHPRRMELSGNGIDDDCASGVDQNEPMYSSAGYGNTTSAFTMYVFVNDSAAAALGSGATGEVEVEELGSGVREIRARQNVPVYDTWWGGPMVNVVVDGLDATTVYRARIRFYRQTYTPSLGSPGSYIWTEVGSASDWYYTTTDGTTDKTMARTRIVLNALDEVEESDHGHVGYLGTWDVDGTRYDADVNENWCSEFYVWSAGDELTGMSGFNHYDQLIDYFSDYDSWYTGSTNIETEGRRGDYVGMDTDDDGEINHSGMVLAVDADGSHVWTVEGNTGYSTVAVRERVLGEEVLGLGHITNAMLS